MNILEKSIFCDDKVSVVQIRKSDKINYFSVALGENAVLKKHKTPVPATLTVLKGEINFVLADREYVFKEFDTFEIPVGEEHEVRGILKQNMFTVIQEL